VLASEVKASKPVEPSKARFHLTRFHDIAITEGVAYLVRDLLPTMGLVVAWGPPKCGKSFWITAVRQFCRGHSVTR
jgi:hypothetical protein